jgi:PAS domain S-box-containing protein
MSDKRAPTNDDKRPGCKSSDRPDERPRRYEDSLAHRGRLRAPQDLQVRTEAEQELRRQLLKTQDQLAKAEAGYRDLRHKYQALFDFTPTGYLLVNQRGVIREANRTAATLLQTPIHELAGQPLTRYIHPDYRSQLEIEVSCLPGAEHPHRKNVVMMGSDGSTFAAHFQGRPCRSASTEDSGTHVCFIDISRETALTKDLTLMIACMEIAAAASSRQPLLEGYVAAIKSYAECDAVGIRLLEPDGGIPYRAYEGFSRQFYERESPLVLHEDQCMCIEVVKGRTPPGKPFFTAWGSFFTNASSRLLATFPPGQLGQTRNVCNEQGYESVALVPIRSGDRIAGLIHVADRREDRLPTGILNMLEKAAQRLGMALDRLAIQKELDRSLAEQRYLAIKLIQAQEDEQRRLAMELHDQTGQDLSVLKLRAIDIHHRLLACIPEMAGKCDQMEAFIDKIIEDVRRMAHGLSPAALDILGLAAAVKALITDYATHVNWQIKADLTALDEIPDMTAQIAVYRIIQEALHNIFKHASAGTVCVQARCLEDHLIIDISDDGCGFDLPASRERTAQSRSLGLAAMRLRARMIGTRLEHTSRPGQGTQIRLDLPLARRKDAP